MTVFDLELGTCWKKNLHSKEAAAVFPGYRQLSNAIDQER